MQTYGRKWRTKKTACDNGHVIRSNVVPLLRLDSTGEVSSEGYCSVSGKDYLCAEGNNNNRAMKNLVTNRTFNFNGMTGATNFSKTKPVDINANNVFEAFTNLTMNTTSAMNSTPHHKVIQPQCSISGWNYNGKTVNSIFPCHQFTNSFNSACKYFGYPRQFNPLQTNRDFQYCAGFGSPMFATADRTWRFPRQGSCNDGGYKKVCHTSEHIKSVPVKCSSTNRKRSQADNVDSSLDHSTCKSFEKEMTVPQEIRVTLAGSDSVIMACAKNVEDNKLNVQGQVDKPKTVKTVEGIASLNIDTNKIPIRFNMSHSVDIDPEQGSNVDSQDCIKMETPVLAMHNNWRKGRASANKKHRRRRQKCKISASPTFTETSPVVKYNIGVFGSQNVGLKPETCAKSLSFVCMTVSPTSTPNSKAFTSNFVVSFSDEEVDTDSDSSDWDEVDFRQIDSELIGCDLLRFLPSPCSSSSTVPLNFEVCITGVEGNEGKSLADLNSSWNIQISLKEKPKAKSKISKKVHFPCDKELKTVHPMIAWAYAYKAARKGEWEYYVRDRDRFQRRVEELEDMLACVLNAQHRQLIYVERFQSLV